MDLNNLMVAREVSDMFNGITNAGILETGLGPLLSFSLFFFPPKRGAPVQKRQQAQQLFSFCNR